MPLKSTLFILALLLASFTLALLLASSVKSAPNSRKSRNRLVILMLDGVRHDYFKRDVENLEAFQKIQSQGVVADYVQPVFPSSSYPSWTTIVTGTLSFNTTLATLTQLTTGLYPDEHGLIGNYMIDLESGKNFSLSNDESTNDPMWWKDHTPAWSTFQARGN